MSRAPLPRRSSSERPMVTYLNQSEWMVNGHRLNWADAHQMLVNVHHMRFSQANEALVDAVRLDRAQWYDKPAPPAAWMGGDDVA